MLRPSSNRIASLYRPGEGTILLLTYEDARPWAKAMRHMVQQRQMPPWFEDGHTEKFENNRSLTQAQIDTIVAWVNAGAPKGDPKDLPPPRQFVQGWSIPKPDVIFQLPRPFSVPDSGILDYQYVILPTRFTQDRWVQFVGGAVASLRGASSLPMYDDRGRIGKDQPRMCSSKLRIKDRQKADPDDVPSDWLVGYAPGQPPDIFVAGQAKLVPAGSDIVLEVHYMPRQSRQTSRRGTGFAKEPPKSAS
jgi:hypothetical protein